MGRNPALIGVIMPSIVNCRAGTGGDDCGKMEVTTTLPLRQVVNQSHNHNNISGEVVEPRFLSETNIRQDDHSMTSPLLGAKEAMFESKIMSERPRAFNVTEVTLPMPRHFQQRVTAKLARQNAMESPPPGMMEQKKILSSRVIYLNDSKEGSNENCKWRDNKSSLLFVD